MKRRFQIPHEWYFLLPITGFLGLFVFYPLCNILIRGFIDNSSGNFTLQNYINIFTQARYMDALKNTLWFAGVCTLVGAVGGTFVGLLASRMSPKARGVLLSFYSLPMTLSSLVVAFSFVVLLGRNGVFNIIINRYLGLPRFDLYSWQGLVVTYSFYNIPLMTLTMASVFLNLDRSLVEAARNLGAKSWQVWLYVIIPVLAPGFLAGISIVLAGMLAAFGTALALTGMAKMLFSLQIYSHASESNYNIPQASALAVVLIIVIAFSLIVLNWIERRLRPGGSRR
ncbi:MAG: hypothetical protein DRN68_02380 [Thaumarchaeota archaeon]|nr:MAG: hypothetical protein DRN68_02380 [Nitrososphaerota archaeon]